MAHVIIICRVKSGKKMFKDCIKPHSICMRLVLSTQEEFSLKRAHYGHSPVIIFLPFSVSASCPLQSISHAPKQNDHVGHFFARRFFAFQIFVPHSSSRFYFVSRFPVPSFSSIVYTSTVFFSFAHFWYVLGMLIFSSLHFIWLILKIRYYSKLFLRPCDFRFIFHPFRYLLFLISCRGFFATMFFLFNHI